MLKILSSLVVILLMTQSISAFADHDDSDDHRWSRTQADPAAPYDEYRLGERTPASSDQGQENEMQKFVEDLGNVIEQFSVINKNPTTSKKDL